MKRSLSITIIIISVLLSSCHDTDTTENKIIETGNKMIETDREIEYLALGDSYTIGESVDPSLRWPVQLVERLKKDSVYIADAEIIAQTGWTTDELINGIESAEPGNEYDLVSLLIGVNNQYRGRDISNFRDELVELLGIATGFAGDISDNVIVLSIPDWGVMPFAGGRDREQIASEIDAFNKVVREECNNTGLQYFDITDISRQASYDNSLVAEDGLHPSGKMYSLWVDRIYSYVYELLK